jgi:hypothetical protein
MAVVNVSQSVILDQNLALLLLSLGAESVLDLWTESTNTNRVLRDSGNGHFHTSF